MLGFHSIAILILAVRASHLCMNNRAFAFVPGNKWISVHTTYRPTPAAVGGQNNRNFEKQSFWLNSEAHRGADGFQPPKQHDYVLEEGSDPSLLPTCSFTEAQVHALIARRLVFKKSRKFPEADRILDALHKNGIHLQDHKRLYRVDGQKHFGRTIHSYQRRGDAPGVSDERLNNIQKLVEERARVKKMRDFYACDDLTDELKEEYGVRVDDKRREWRIAGAQQRRDHGEPDDDVAGPSTTATIESWYVPTPLAPGDHATHTMDASQQLHIRNRLKDRSDARRAKNYKEADAIRDELLQEYSIVIDDRTREWKVVVPAADDGGDEWFDDVDDSANDPFVRGANLSQRSAFVREKRGD